MRQQQNTINFQVLQVPGLPPLAGAPFPTVRLDLKVDEATQELVAFIAIATAKVSPIAGASEMIPIEVCELWRKPFAEVVRLHEAEIARRAAERGEATEGPRIVPALS